MKQTAKQVVVAILGWQLRRLRRKNDLTVVAVAGSIGKTTTKYAIAELLDSKYKVRWQKGNYNDIVTVPLVFFGLPLPSLTNPVAWLRTFLKIEKQLASKYHYDVVVVELGTDFPGNLRQFKRYLRADIGVLTAITPEHMEFFENLEVVAAEELTLLELSRNTLINLDLCDSEYLKIFNNFIGYGMNKTAKYQVRNIEASASGYNFSIFKHGERLIKAKIESPAKSQISSVTAAVAVADLMGVENEIIQQHISLIRSVPGRMHLLSGIKKSVIIDDTYNASPEAAKSALDTLYAMKAPQKIALLGNMNELGEHSRRAHEDLGNYCDPTHLDLVVTLGADANKYLAEKAQAKGCRVIRSTNPYQAAKEIRTVMKDNALILAKGSQNGVFAEEAVKQLLADPQDVGLLVRQGAWWIKKKKEQFGALQDNA